MDTSMETSVADVRYPAALLRAGRIVNSGQTRSLMLTGSIGDLWFDPKADDGRGDYVPLPDLLVRMWSSPSRVVLTYQLNGPVRFRSDDDFALLARVWQMYGISATGGESDSETNKRLRDQFAAALRDSQGKPALALELLSQICLKCREARFPKGNPRCGEKVMDKSLVIIVEGTELIIPEGEVGRLSDADRMRVAICQDWLSDPGFQRGADAVVLLAESRGSINARVARLPQLIDVELPAPDEARRRHCIDWFNTHHAGGVAKVGMDGGADLAAWTAGLSLHALMQLLRGAAYGNGGSGTVDASDVIPMIETYIKSQLGDDVVEFKRPSHRLDAVKGNLRLKAYLVDEVIPRASSRDNDVISSILVSGPIGGGKTFIMEAVAATLDMPVMELKSIRSQWFGQTDVIIERLRRVLASLSRVCIFIDEADAQFGDISTEQHATEKRVSGAILRMMSDPRFKGRILWLLMTARPHLLPPDMRREGRGGNLVIPILDPSLEEDKHAFLEWVFLPVAEEGVDKALLLEQLSSSERVQEHLETYSADSFKLLRSELKARKVRLKRALTPQEIIAVVEEIIPPDIELTRRYQTLQALMNCTRKSLLPPFEGKLKAKRLEWAAEIRRLELEGIR